MGSNNNVDIAAHVEDLTKLLGDKVGKEITIDELEKELQRFLEYGVPIQQAKKTIIKKYKGVTTKSSGKRKLLKDILPNEPSVNIIGRIITINPKEIEIKGENRKIFYGMIADESGVVPFTAWRDFNIEKGQVLKITNAYTKSWRGIPQLNFGERTKIELSDEEIPETYQPKKCKVEDLKSGIGLVDVTVKVLSVKEREVDIEGNKKKVYSGIIADESGKAQFTAWHDFKLKEGDVIKIAGGYVKSWRGIPQLTFDEKCKVEKLDSKNITEIKTRKYKLWEVVERGGVLDVEVEGTVIEVREGSGLIIRCPECNRVLVDGKCRVHGGVNGVFDLRAKIVLDDGTGAINVIVNRSLTEKLIQKSLDEIKKIYDETNDGSRIFELIKDKFLANNIRFTGNALRDEFGTTLIAKDAELIEIDVKDEARKLLQQIER
jgi:replication factor A1